METRNRNIGYFILTVGMFSWGANFGIVKSAYTFLAPLPFGAIRFTFSGIVLLAAMLWYEKGVSIRREDIGGLFKIGVLGLGLYQVFWSLGLNLTSASNSALILSVQPLLGALYATWIEKEPIEKGKYFGMLLALAGVVMVVLKPTVRLNISVDTLAGDFLTFLAAICSSIFFSTWSKPLLKKYSPLKLMGYCMIATAATLWVATFIAAQTLRLDQMGTTAIGALAYSIIISGVIGHVLWYEGIARVGVTHSLIFLYLLPICAVLFNYLVMGERVFLQQIIGGVMILLGVHRGLKSR